MATIIATTPISSGKCADPALRQQPIRASSSLALGMPAMATKGRVTCRLKQHPSVEKKSNTTTGMGASLISAFCAATVSSPAMALVDDRMSTEGTGLPFGLSNNLLGWILFGVFGLIWSLYFIYTSNLEEDEDSGLSL